MPSLDYLYDLSDKLKEDNIDYLLIAIRKNKKEEAAEVLFRLTDKDSMNALKTILHRLDIEGAVRPSKNDDNE
jgi:hypothetical protein